MFNVIESDVHLYDHNGNPIVVGDGDSIDSNNKGMIIAGVDENNNAQFLATDVYGNLPTKPSEYTQTAFGEIRAATPHLVGNNVNKYGLDTNKYNTSVSGGGSVSEILDQSSIRLSVGATSGDFAKLRTHQYYRYQAGRSMLCRFTSYHADTGQSNQIRRWGLFDDNDGIFFELNGTTLYIVRRTSTSGSVVDNKVVQSSWNQDILDGTGKSGLNLDITKGNIFEISLQWLGVGIVNVYINSVLCHKFNNPNQFSVPYMKTAVLPLSWEVINDGASTASSMTYICSSVSVEGGQDVPEFSFAAYCTTDLDVGVTEVPLISIRPKTTFNTVENRMSIIPKSALISNEGGRASYRFVLDGTLTGASFSSVDANSGTEYDVSATSISGGITMHWGLLANSIDSDVVSLSDLFANTARSLRMKAFSTTDVNVLTIMGKYEKSSGTTLMRASISWQEAR